MAFKHFNLDQFDCPCCGKNWAKVELLTALDSLQDIHPSPIKILSGYRCFAHNLNVGGVRNSQHTLGKAADLHSDQMDRLFEDAEKLFKSIGDGRSRGFIHVDLRADKERRWTY